MRLIIHGHFYQPPRENPWTGRIPPQETGTGHSDWNERISAECYGPNARSRVLGENGRIERIVNNYETIHFDFGPTLLNWIERHDPETYREILEADARSRESRGGHGNAIAQAYNHMILPLANERDRRTQIAWGMRDFERRFGRRSASIWLPETAIDPDTLRLLTEFGIRYIILAPSQARRVRPLSGGEWIEATDGRIDPGVAYRVFPFGSAERPSLDVFFYNGAISAGISFDHLLRNAGHLSDRLAAAMSDANGSRVLSIATDGEVYGHHEPFGDMCLAYLSAVEGPQRGFRFTNYGAELDISPPTHEVELDFGPDGRGSAWSCTHGIGRWERDCGCVTGGKPDWGQHWRAPLREALNHLRDRLAETFVSVAGLLLRDPWEAREEYIEVLLGAQPRDSFLSRHARKPLSDSGRLACWRLLESQHQAMLMFTSCGWFFADLAGTEGRQNLAHAARAIELAAPYADSDLEGSFLRTLRNARSNRPSEGTGEEIYERRIRPMRRQAERIAAEGFAEAASGARPGVESPAFSVRIDSCRGSLRDGGATGRAVVADLRTGEEWSFGIEAARDDRRVVLILVRPDDAGADGKASSFGFSDLDEELRRRLAEALLTDLVATEQEHFERLFRDALPILRRFGAGAKVLPPIFSVLSETVLQGRTDRTADALARVPHHIFTGATIRDQMRELLELARSIGLSLPARPIAAVVETAIEAALRDPGAVTTDDARRCIGLLREAEAAGIEIRRTRVEEKVYGLLLYARAAGATGGKVDTGTMSELADLANLNPNPPKRSIPSTLERTE